MPFVRSVPGSAARWLLLACLVVASAALSHSASAQARLRIALLPIVVHSGENPEYLRDGLADMLNSRFIQGGVFEVVRVDDPKKATTRLQNALETARSVKADFVLFGSFTRFGTGASLDMQAAATATGEQGETLREIFVHSGSIGEVIPDLKDLVGKVTRFAISDYAPTPPPAAGGADAAGEGRAGSRAANLEELRRRVAELEKAVEALKAASQGSR